MSASSDLGARSRPLHAPGVGSPVAGGQGVARRAYRVPDNRVPGN